MPPRRHFIAQIKRAGFFFDSEMRGRNIIKANNALSRTFLLVLAMIVHGLPEGTALSEKHSDVNLCIKCTVWELNMPLQVDTGTKKSTTQSHISRHRNPFPEQQDGQRRLYDGILAFHHQVDGESASTTKSVGKYQEARWALHDDWSGCVNLTEK